MVKLLRYIELKSGHSDNGPTWIAYVEQSKTGRTLYFKWSGTDGFATNQEVKGEADSKWYTDKAVRYRQLPPEAEGVRLELAKCVTSQNSEDDMFRSGARALRPERRAARPSSENAVFAKIPESLAARPDLSRLSNALLSTNELADLIGFAPKTIRRWASRRLLNFIRVGNQFRFRPAAVELFLAQREIRK